MSENYNATGEIKEIGILDMMNGAIGERTAYELTRIMKNCRDFNTEAKKARTLTIKLSIVPTENRDTLVQLISTVTTENGVSLADDGMTQRVTARSGISLGKQVSVPNPVVLAPYRTFTEVEQPKSPFVFRIRQTGDEVQAALFAADADAWKREAIANIRDWFEQHIPQELREDVIILA